MAKLTLLLATFAVLLLVTNASIYRTTIQINDEKQQSCQEQIQEQQQLNDCQQYIKREYQQSGNSRGRGNQKKHLQECCQQLQELDTQCRCQGLRQAVQQQQQQEGLRGEEVQDMYEIAKDLPSTCGMPPKQCDMRSSRWY